MTRSARGRARLSALAGAVVLVSFLAVACGSRSTGSPGASGLDTSTLLKQLRSVQKGEFVIIGKRPVRFSGPYLFRPGGYVFHFTQAAREDGSRPRLRVSLESHQGSRKHPYQRLVDTNRPEGRVAVTIGGRLFVHVITSSPSYLLRFTPRTRDR